MSIWFFCGVAALTPITTMIHTHYDHTYTMITHIHYTHTLWLLTYTIHTL